MSAERKKLTATQQAILHKAEKNPEWSNTQIANAVGCSDSHVSKTLNKWEPDELDEDGSVPDPSLGYADAIPSEEVDSGIYPLTIVGVSVAWLAGLGLIFIGYDTAALLGLFVMFGSWLALPVVVALDTISLHNQKAPFRPNRILWPGLALVLGVVGGFAYFATRISNL